MLRLFTLALCVCVVSCAFLCESVHCAVCSMCAVVCCGWCASLAFAQCVASHVSRVCVILVPPKLSTRVATIPKYSTFIILSYTLLLQFHKTTRTSRTLHCFPARKEWTSVSHELLKIRRAIQSQVLKSTGKRVVPR